MKNIIKCCFLVVPFLYSTTHAMDSNTIDHIAMWNQLAEEQQKQQTLEDKQTQIAAAKYYMLTEQLIPFYLIPKLDKATSTLARLHNEELLQKTTKK